MTIWRCRELIRDVTKRTVSGGWKGNEAVDHALTGGNKSDVAMPFVVGGGGGSPRSSAPSMSGAAVPVEPAAIWLNGHVAQMSLKMYSVGTQGTIWHPGLKLTQGAGCQRRYDAALSTLGE
jgi:hypothetical protein